jgi:S-adenosylmethionine/arginine decarboxylase-like enzyme
MPENSNCEANSIEVVCCGVKESLFDSGEVLHDIVLSALLAESYSVEHQKQVAFEGSEFQGRYYQGWSGTVVISESHMNYRLREMRSEYRSRGWIPASVSKYLLELMLKIDSKRKPRPVDEHDFLNYHTYAEFDRTVNFNLNTCRGPDAGWVTVDHIVRSVEPRVVLVDSRAVPLGGKKMMERIYASKGDSKMPGISVGGPTAEVLKYLEPYIRKSQKSAASRAA